MMISRKQVKASKNLSCLNYLQSLIIIMMFCLSMSIYPYYCINSNMNIGVSNINDAFLFFMYCVNDILLRHGRTCTNSNCALSFLYCESVIFCSYSIKKTYLLNINNSKNINKEVYTQLKKYSCCICKCSRKKETSTKTFLKTFSSEIGSTKCDTISGVLTCSDMTFYVIIDL